MDKIENQTALNLHHTTGGETTAVDVFLFMGQSNMAGRGAVCAAWPEQAPTILPGAGYEFRAVSDPTKLFPMTEPFGVNENRQGYIDDGSMKTGSMVTAFTNAYFTNTGLSSKEGTYQILFVAFSLVFH